MQGRWSAPLQIGAGPDRDSRADIASAGGGWIFATWSSGDQPNQVSLALIRPGATRWDSVTTLSSPLPTEAYAPRLAATNEGHALVVWRHLDETDIVASHFDPQTSSWTAPRALCGADMLCGSPLIAMGPGPEATVLWGGIVDGDNALYVNRSTADGAWLGTTRISEPSPIAVAHGLAVSTEGEMVAAWLAGSGRTHVYVSQTDGDRWTTPARIDSEDDAGGPSVDWLTEARAIAAWPQLERGQASVMVAVQSAETGDWAPPEPLATADDIRELTVSANRRGDAFVHWLEAARGSKALKVRHFDASSQSWAETIVLSVSVETERALPELGVDACGNATIVWEDGSGAWAGRFDAGRQAWEEPQPLGDEWAHGPRLAVAPLGEVTVLWEAWHGTRELMSARWGSPPP